MALVVAVARFLWTARSLHNEQTESTPAGCKMPSLLNKQRIIVYNAHLNVQQTFNFADVHGEDCCCTYIVLQTFILMLLTFYVADVHICVADFKFCRPSY